MTTELLGESAPMCERALTRTGCLSLLRVSKFVSQRLVYEAAMELIRGFHNI